MAITVLFRHPLLALVAILLLPLAVSGLAAAEKKAETPPPNKPAPSLRNTNWDVAWKDAEGVAVKGRMSFTAAKVSCSQLQLGDVSYTEKGSWGGRKFDQAKISFKGTGKDAKGNKLTISGEVQNSRNLTATVVIKTKDGEQKFQVSGNP